MNPLDQLVDISIPDNVSVWPLPWGYWLIIVLVIIALAFTAVALIQYRAKRKVKYRTLTALSTIDINDPYFAHKTQVALKSISAHYLPHANSKTLHSGQWQSFLLSIYKGKKPQELTKAITSLNLKLYSTSAKLDIKGEPSLTNNHEGQNVTLPNQQILDSMKEFVSSSFPVNNDIQASHSKPKFENNANLTNTNMVSSNKRINHA